LKLLFHFYFFLINYFAIFFSGKVAADSCDRITGIEELKNLYLRVIGYLSNHIGQKQGYRLFQDWLLA